MRTRTGGGAPGRHHLRARRAEEGDVASFRRAKVLGWAARRNEEDAVGLTKVVPFLVEECFVDTEPAAVDTNARDDLERKQRKYLVTKVLDVFKDDTFKAGVEVTHWNGIPIERMT